MSFRRERKHFNTSVQIFQNKVRFEIKNIKPLMNPRRNPYNLPSGLHHFKYNLFIYLQSLITIQNHHYHQPQLTCISILLQPNCQTILLYFIRFINIQQLSNYSKVLQHPYLLYIFSMEFSKYAIVLLTTFALSSICTSDYIVNGGFEMPALPVNGWMSENSTGWMGSNYEVWNPGTAAFEGQVIDLQAYFGLNGYIEQTAFISNMSKCTLSFLRTGQVLHPLSQIVEVYWNGHLQTTIINNSTLHVLQSLIVYPVPGNNTVKFQQIGDDWVDGAGTILETVNLTCVFIPPPPPSPSETPLTPQQSQQPPIEFRQVKYALSAIFAAIANQIAGLRVLYLLAEDIWLYSYDQWEYEGIVQTVFNTTTTVESWKFIVLESSMHWGKANGSMKVSDYKLYTRKKFVQIQSQSSVLIKAAFPYFIYTIPMNTLIVLALYLGFTILSKYKASQYFRKYYFMRAILLQVLIEGNVVYFVYICFGHLSTSFSFTFRDKLALIFTLAFFWCVVVFVFVFYSLVGKFLKQRAGYFLYGYYRCNEGYFVITAKNLVRNFLRGSIYYFLNQFYTIQMAFLSIVEVLEIIIVIPMETTKKIFILKTFYCLELLFNFLFILLNFSFYFAFASDSIYFDSALKKIALQLQTIIIYLMISCTLLGVVFDLLPLNWLKRGSSKELKRKDQQEMVIKLPQSQIREKIQKQNREMIQIQGFLQQKIGQKKLLRDLSTKNQHEKQKQNLKNDEKLKKKQQKQRKAKELNNFLKGSQLTQQSKLKIQLKKSKFKKSTNQRQKNSRIDNIIVTVIRVHRKNNNK